MPPRKAGDRGTEQIGSNRGNGPHRYSADFPSGHFLNLGARFAYAPQDLARLRQKRSAKLRQTCEPREAVEQLGAKLILEFAHLLRKRRLRNVLLLGGTCEVSRPRYRAEIP